MKRLPLLSLTAAALLTAAACKKDQNNPQPSSPTQPTTEQLLADKLWLMTGAKVTPGLPTTTGATVTDLYPLIPACTKDDTQQFVSGGVYKTDEGPTKCDAADPQTTTGTWATAKSGSDTSITLTVNGTALHFQVLALTDTQLQLSSSDDVFGLGTGYTYTLTYSKK